MRAAAEHIFTGTTAPLSGPYDPTKTMIGSLMKQYTGPNSSDKYTYTAASTTKQSSTIKLGTYGSPGAGFYLTLYGYFVGKSLDASQEAILRGAWSTLMAKIVR